MLPPEATTARSVCDLVTRWAQTQPDYPAISFEDRTVSYRELENAATRIACLLIYKHVRPGEKVPVLAELNPEMVACFLGVLKAGACYVPIDAESWSNDRIRWTLDKVSARTVLNTAEGDGLRDLDLCGYDVIGPSVLQPMLSPAFPGLLRDIVPALPEQDIEPEDLIFTIFTSGTTSEPKGVMVPHSSVLNYVQQGGRDTPFNLNASPADRILLIYAPAFDACAGVVFSTLCNGAELVIADTSNFHQAATRCTVLPATPSILATIQDPTSCSQLRMILLGGEMPPPSLIQKWSMIDCPIYNGYGPTEATFLALIAQLHPDRPITLGVPMSNSQVFLLDDRDEEADYGEICITGPGVARGYYENESLTVDKFVLWRGQRMYRTGDFAQRTPHGLEFSGRKDSYVKNRGFLVNLDSQVVSMLYASPGVSMATALMHSGRLIGFVTPETLDGRILRRKLAQKHDAFLVPDRIVALDVFPLTPNGKIDNRALRALLDTETDTQAADDAGIAQPPPQLHKDGSKMGLLRDAVASALGGLPLGEIRDNLSFWELGGNSLAGLKVLSALRQKGFSLRLESLFHLPSLTTVGDAMEADTQRDDTEESRQGDETSAPMSALQMKMAHAGLRNPRVNYILLRISMGHLGDSIDAADVHSAWYRVLHRHPIFRTQLQLFNGVQETMPDLSIDWDSQECEDEGELERAVEVHAQNLRQRIAHAQYTNQCFAPINALRLVTAPDNQSVLLALFHHIQGDGWSFGVLLEEVSAVLQHKPLPPVVSFMEVARAQKREQFNSAAKEFWQTTLREYIQNPPPRLALLPPPCPNGAAASEPSWAKKARVCLDATPAELQRSARAWNVTPATLVYTAWGLVLSNYTSSDRVIFGAVLSGRNLPVAGIERVVGPLINTCPFPLHFQDNESLQNLLSEIDRRLLQMLEYQWSLTDVMADLTTDQIDGAFQSLVAIDHETSSLPWQTEREDVTEFDLILQLETTDQLTACMLFDGDRYTGSSMNRMLGHFGNALSGILRSSPPASVHGIRDQIIQGEEHSALLQADNVVTNGLTSPGQPQTVKDAFEATAARWPDHLAVESANGSMTYGELDRAANRVAHGLARMCEPGDTVAIFTDGSMHWVVGILAVLKAGRICCPVDINLPATRIKTILCESGAAVALAANRGCAMVNPHILTDRVIIVDEYLGAGLDDSDTQLQTIARPKDVVYLVFTSGSTGVPKGVPLHNLSFLLLLDTPTIRLASGAGRRVAQVCSVGFDLATVEILGAVCHGGTLVLKDPEDPFAHLHEVDTIMTTPSFISAYSPKDFKKLTTLVLGGEPVPQALASEWATKELWNVYGPSECGPFSTTIQLRPDEEVSIGRPLPHVHVYILDHHQRPVPVGVAGEIFISSEQTVSGYWEGATSPGKESFTPNPFLHGQGMTMYRTGDVGFWNEDGTIAYLGRRDNQVKVRGYRIELEEIERAVRLANSAITAAGVIVADQVRIVAFVSPGDIDTAALHHTLAALLPSYARPGEILALDELPKSANYKVDRAALQAMAASTSFASSPAEADLPATQTEKTIAAVWKALLSLPEERHVRRQDSFLAIGGNSLLAVKAARHIAVSLGQHIPLPILIRQTVLADLAQTIDKFQPPGEGDWASFPNYLAQENTSLEDWTRPAPAGYLEEELFLLHTISDTPSALTTTVQLVVHGEMNHLLLQEAIVSVIAETPILRARYSLSAGALRRRIAQEVTRPFVFAEDELGTDKLQDLINEPFDLDQDQLFRVFIWQRGRDVTSITLATHHIITDKASLALILQSVSAKYASGQLQASPADSSYLAWASWTAQRPSWHQSETQRRVAYWKQQLAGSKPIQALQHNAGQQHGLVQSILIPYLSLDTRYSQRLAIAATALALCVVFETTDFVLGIPYMNRDEAGTSSLVGLLLDRLPIRIQLDKMKPLTTTETLLSTINDLVTGAVENALPYHQLQALLRSLQPQPLSPLINVLLTYHWASDSLAQSLTLPVANHESGQAPQAVIQESSTRLRTHGAKLPLLFEYTETEEGLLCDLEYNPQILSPRHMAVMRACLPGTLRDLALGRTPTDILARLRGSISLPTSRHCGNNGTAIAALAEAGGGGIQPELLDTEYEKRIGTVRATFASVLDVHIAEIHSTTSFFEKGGSSVLVLKMHWLLGQAGLRGQIRDIFSGATTPAEIAWLFC